MPKPVATEYRELVEKLLSLRAAGTLDEALEEELLSCSDTLWDKMTKAERAQESRWAADWNKRNAEYN